MKRNILLFLAVFLSVFNLVAMQLPEPQDLNPLIAAIRASNVDAVTINLDHGQVDFDIEYDDLSTLLGQAVINNNPYSQNNASLIDSLLERGADPEVLVMFQDEMLPPLFISTLKSDRVTAKKLLDRGAQGFFLDDVDVITGIETILARDNNTFMLRFFMENGFDINKKLLEHAQHMGLEITHFLLRNGADPNFADPETGQTPLLYACEYKNKEFVEMLVNFGADIHKCDREGISPLMKAAQSGFYEIVKYFIWRGTNILARDKDGFTPLLYACLSGQVNIVDYLRDCGAVLDDKDFEGKTSLMCAAASGSFPMVEYLLKQNVNKTAQDESGKTALIYAAIKGDLATFQALQGTGLDKHHRCTKNKDTLMYAAKKGHMALVSWLLFDVHNMQARDNKDRTAHDIACQERETIIEQLRDETEQEEPGQDDIMELMEEGQNATNVVEALRNPRQHLKRNKTLVNNAFRKPLLSKFTKGNNIVNALHTRSLGQRISIKRIKPRILGMPKPDQNAPW